MARNLEINFEIGDRLELHSGLTHPVAVAPPLRGGELAPSSTHGSRFTIHCPLSTIHCPLSTIHCPLPTVHYSLSTVHCPLSTVHCPLFPSPKQVH
jgi:hypothetical protein